MITVVFVLAIVAFLLVLASAVPPNRVPLWVAVLFLSIIELLRVLPIRLFLFVALAAGATACTMPPDFVASDGVTLVTLIFSGVAAVLAHFHIRSAWLSGFLSRLVIEARAAALEVSQTYTDEIKLASADGDLTDAEKAEAKRRALSTLKSNLGQKGLDRVKRILGIDSVDTWLSTHLEAAVNDAKTTAAVVGKPVIVVPQTIQSGK